jgi:hypothetical protein
MEIVYLTAVLPLHAEGLLSLYWKFYYLCIWYKYLKKEYLKLAKGK